MIDLYNWPTPNGHKIHIALEEMGLDYTVHPVNIGKGEQFEPDFLAISPNNKIPAMVDQDGPGGKPYAMFESGAMLLYLGEKTGKFLPRETAARYRTVQWLMFQMGHVGPMLGQAHHFREYAVEKIPYAIDRYTNESARLLGVIDKRLGAAAYLAGDDYTVADMAVFPWLRNPEREGWDPADYPNMSRWFKSIVERPAVRRGLDVMKEFQRRGPIDDTWRRNMFGETQHVRR